MSEVSRLAEIKKLLVIESESIEELQKTDKALEIEDTGRELLSHLADAASAGDIEGLLRVERVFLEMELELHGDSRVKTGSLSAAIEELDVAMGVLAEARNPDKYKATATIHFSLSKDLIGELPRDRARQFFNGHKLRLQDLHKARAFSPEKKHPPCPPAEHQAGRRPVQTTTASVTRHRAACAQGAAPAVPWSASWGLCLF